MNDKNHSKVFRCTITMDYQSITKTITVTRQAPDALKCKKQLKDEVLNSNETVVALAKEDGGFRLINSMKFGDMDVEEVDRHE